jgi:hypothetical protein
MRIETSVQRIASLCLVGILAFSLGGCDPERMAKRNQAKAATTSENRTVCLFEGEKLGMQRGVQARQLVVDGKISKAGPVVYWSTPDFTGVNNKGPKPGEAPYLQVLLGWRMSMREKAPESPLDSVIVRARGIDPATIPAGARWRVSIVDDEQHDIEFTPPAPGKPIEAKFTPEGGGGLTLPDIIAEALGGINGGRFVIALTDASGEVVIASRDVRPPRGYEFKILADKAIEGVKPLANKPETCTTPATF